MPASAPSALTPPRSDDPASLRHLSWSALCAVPSRVVPRVSTAARPHDNKRLGQPKGTGSCHDRRGVSAAGRIHARSGGRFHPVFLAACRADLGATAASARHMPLMLPRCIERRAWGVAGMRRPARGTKARRVALPRAGLKVDASIDRLCQSVGQNAQAGTRRSVVPAQPITNIRRL